MAAWTYHVPNSPLSGWYESVAVGTKIYHFELGDEEEEPEEEEEEEEDEEDSPRIVFSRDSPPPPPCSLRVRIFDTEDFSWRTVPLLHSETQGEERCMPPDVESLVAATQGHVVYLLGTTRDQSVRCFDTRTLRWSCALTRGDVPRRAVWKFACHVNGTIFAWGRHELSSKCVFALELSTLSWRSVRVDAGPTTYQLSLAVALGACIYVLYTRRPRLDAKRDDCRVAVFDTTREEWLVRGEPYGHKLFHRTTCCIFARARRIYALALRAITSPDLLVVEYSPQRNEWRTVALRGVAPRDYLRSPAVVGGKAFFHSPNERAVHVLDFCPSLRTLCFLTVVARGIDFSALPDVVKRELRLFMGKP